MADLARRSRLLALVLIFLGPVLAGGLAAQSLDIPSKTWGLSFGNSKTFTGLRFNFRDNQVRKITGVNVTLWRPRKDNKDAVVTGLSLGLAPGGGRLIGAQLGILGAGAESTMIGLNVGGFGVGAGEDLIGVNIGGFGAGAGENVTGITLGGLGAGAGTNLFGIAIGGLGVGAGEDVTGICIGGLGVGAGETFKGIAIGGLGAGAGENITGLVIGGLGAGCGENLKGIVLAGLGAGAGRRLTGLAICGLAAGAPLRNALLRPPLVVQQGHTTRLVLNGPGFSIQSEGQALANASRGDRVRVKTLSGQVVSGVAQDGQQVVVAF